MSKIGYMPMPADFKWAKVFLEGKPVHDRYDPFRIRHPEMDVRQWAKIFAPFAALQGFDEAVSDKEILYTEMREPSPESCEELDRRLSILQKLTYNSRTARENDVKVSVTYYEPCKDQNRDEYGTQGQYPTITGTCRRVDTALTRTIQVDDKRIPLRSILNIESPGGLFEKEWEEA